MKIGKWDTHEPILLRPGTEHILGIIAAVVLALAIWSMIETLAAY